MKPIVFLGDSEKQKNAFPKDVADDADFCLRQLQYNEEPSDVKPFNAAGAGTYEIRLWDDTGTYRVMYVAKFKSAIYVLHAFQKKTQQTDRLDIEKAKTRYKEAKRRG